MALLEREDAIRGLTGWLEEAATGRGRLVLIGGDAGVGKTSLLDAFCDRRQRILRGACDALLTPRPLGPMFDLARVLGGDLLELLEAGAPRERMFGTLLDELGRVAPTIVVVEDVHWADEATLDLLRFLARRIGATGSLVLVTHRTDEAGARESLQLLLGDLATSPDVRRLQLSALSLAAVTELMQGTEREAQVLHRATGGNPFFVTEVLAADEPGVPGTVRDAVLARARRLTLPAQDTLRAAAIVPHHVEAWLLDAIGPGDPEAVEECVSWGILVPDAAGLAFRHELAREAIEQATPANLARRLHQRALTALGLHAGTRDDQARLAHHAEAAHDVQRVLEHAPKAARTASSLRAHRQAAAQWSRALRFSDAVAVDRLAPMLEARSYACYLTDQIREAIAAREQALKCRRELGDVRLEGDCLRWLSRLRWFLGERAPAERYANQAVELLETLPPGSELAMAYSNCSQLAMLEGDDEAAIAWGRLAIDLAERVGDDECVAHALNNVGTAQLNRGITEGRIALERSLELSLQLGLEEHVARAYTNQASEAAIARRPALAVRYLAPGLRYCAERDLDSWQLYMLGWHARACLDLGRWSDATDAAETVLRRSGATPVTRITALIVIAQVRARRGDPDAQGPLAEAYELAAPTGELQRIGPVAVGEAEAAWLQGRAQAIPELTAQAFALAKRREASWMIGELAYWRWRAGIVEDLPSAAAEPYALQIRGRWDRAATLWSELGCRYEVAMSLADADEDDSLRRSLAELQRLDARPAAAIVTRRLRGRGARDLPRGPRKATRQNPAHLTARELDVLALVAQGLRNGDIADRLFVSKKTVDHHVSAILRKLGTRTRGEASLEAQRLGIDLSTAVLSDGRRADSD